MGLYLPPHVAAMVKLAKERASLKLNDGRTVTLFSWPIPTEFRDPLKPGRKYRNKPVVQDDKGHTFNIVPEDIAEIIASEVAA